MKNCKLFNSNLVFNFRYLKSVYPKAEETFLLDLLSSNDDNVQMASSELDSLGYTKKETHFGPRGTPKPTPEVTVRSPTPKPASFDEKKSS